MVPTKSLRVQLDAILNAEEEMKEKGSEKEEGTLMERRKEETQHGRTKVEIELMSGKKPSFAYLQGSKWLF